MFTDYSYIFDKARDLYALLSYYDKYGKAVMPLRYFFDLTYECNLLCPYCYIGDNRSKNELSFDEWKNVINQVPKSGLISLGGGEPLLREDFIDIFEAASDKVPGRVNVYTNGTLLSEKIIDSFLKHSLLCLSVSLDGIGHVHDTKRGCPGAFDKIVSNLDIFMFKMRNKNKVITDIKSILFDDNLEELPELYEFCNNKGFDFFSISFKRNHNLKQNGLMRAKISEEFTESEYFGGYYFDKNKFESVYAELEKMSKKFKTKLRWAPKFKPCGDLKTIEKIFDSTDKHPSEIYKPCLFPYSNIFINPEGIVYPCFSINMGNIREKSLKEILNTPEYRCFRKNLKAAKMFSACSLCCEAYPKR